MKLRSLWRRAAAAAVALAAVALCAVPAVPHPNHVPQAPAVPAGLAFPADAAAAVDAFHAALRRGDTAAALALLADEVLVLEDGGAERSKAEYASHHLGSDSEFSRAVPSQPIRRTGGAIGDAAWVGTESRVTGSFRGVAVNRVLAETMVLRREAGKWRIVHIHWSSRQSSVE